MKRALLILALLGSGLLGHSVASNEPVSAPVPAATYVRDVEGLADALAEGGADDATTRDWESCAVVYGPTTVIACPDGYTETS